jgi:hypothetical protein
LVEIINKLEDEIADFEFTQPIFDHFDSSLNDPVDESSDPPENVFEFTTVSRKAHML